MGELIDPATKGADSALKIAESVGNLGAMVVITGFVIFLFFLMVLYFFFSHRRMSRNMEKQIEVNNSVLSSTMRELKDFLMPISENSRLSTLTTIYSIAENNFKLSVETVLNIIERIQRENHIDDKETTRRKLRKFLTNINNERILYFRNFSYSGQTVDYYLSTKWIDLIEDVAYSEIYDKNRSRARTNIKQAYDSILIEFKQNLLTK